MTSIRTIQMGGVSTNVTPSGTNVAIETGGNLSNISAAQGTDATGVTAPAGASGIRGWLSGIYRALTNTLNVSVTSG